MDLCALWSLDQKNHTESEEKSQDGDEMTTCHCQVWRIHNRKRDDIRSSGYAWPGETSTGIQPWNSAPQIAISSSSSIKRPPSKTSVTSRYSSIFQFFILLLIYWSSPNGSVMALQLPDIYWNSSNPIFRIDNTDHIIDVNRSPAEFDRVNIYCPRLSGAASTGSSGTDPGSFNYSQRSETAKNGYFIIYNVSKEEYETCRVINPSARRMLVCDNPMSDRLSYVTITFRPFSPQPNGPEFHAGHDYYFISTSTGTEFGLDNKVGGRCSSHNMKLVFKVSGKDAPDPDDATNPPAFKTDFRLPGLEQIPLYGRVDDNPVAPRVATTIPYFFRLRATSAPYRPKIMKFTPIQSANGANVISPENNDLPGNDVQRSDTNDIHRSADFDPFEPKTTTNDYFNLIREEDAAVPGSARQTKSRPNAPSSASVKCQNWISVLLLLFITMQRMLRSG